MTSTTLGTASGELGVRLAAARRRWSLRAASAAGTVAGRAVSLTGAAGAGLVTAASWDGLGRWAGLLVAGGFLLLVDSRRAS
jgi:hypothetical protein